MSQASPSAKNRVLGKANLPRVLHSGKNSTRGREALPSAAECLALGKERHSAKALFPECNTRGRAALGKEKCYLTAQPARAIKTKKLLCRVSHAGTWQRGWLPQVPCHGTRQRASLPSAREGTRGRIFFVFFAPFFCEAFSHYLKLLVQIWDNFDFFLVYFVNFFRFVEFFCILQI